MQKQVRSLKSGMSKIIAKSPTQLDSRCACGYLVPERLLEIELLTG